MLYIMDDNNNKKEILYELSIDDLDELLDNFEKINIVNVNFNKKDYSKIYFHLLIFKK
jgi:hypothetical protein